MSDPSFQEDRISQLPALRLLAHMGYRYLEPDEALAARGGNKTQVLLGNILEEQLRRLNKIHHKGQAYDFSQANIQAAMLALRRLSVQNGFVAANKELYDLIVFGKSFQQDISGYKRSHSLRYIDRHRPQNNVFHVTKEFVVARSESDGAYRPDIVLFVNGIPLVVIECKSPGIKDPIAQAISQQIRNQQKDGIRALYYYSQLALALAGNEARYATTGTPKEHWSVWREEFKDSEEEQAYEQTLQQLKNTPSTALPEALRKESEDEGPLTVCEQDRLLYSLCRHERLLELMCHFILFQDQTKLIARFQQYFGVKRMLERISDIQPDGHRKGGVIWHTQGSGKSLTMVMLSRLIALQPDIKDPRILLVTDRIDLDDQIRDTFEKCGKAVTQARTGQHLAELIQRNDSAVITTVINKFESALAQVGRVFDSSEIFVLVDEGHRSHYGSFNVKMQKIFPKACFIAFTGTPLMNREKNTAAKFDGIAHVYSIADAVRDKTVVELLYEGRHSTSQVNAKVIDDRFNRIAEPLTDYGKAALKKKFSGRPTVTRSISVIENIAHDIAEHFSDHIKGTGFKGQLVTPNKLTAIRYLEIFKEIGSISAAVLISPPDMREGEDDVFEHSDDPVKKFWSAMMDKFGNAERYEKSVIKDFKKENEPELIIVVDKLLTGFDAPKNQVLYLTRSLKDHTLLQAIARVNRVHPGKDHGYIIDYYGNFENLDGALKMYAEGQEAFDKADWNDTLKLMSKELEKLPQAHSELRDIFKEIKNKNDAPAYEELLWDEAARHRFYEKSSLYARLLRLALSSLGFLEDTPQRQIEKYKKDLTFFLALKASVQRRYSDSADHKEYEPQIQKLIDRHIISGDKVLQLTGPVNIFDELQRTAEVEKMNGAAAKADHIASRTIRAINVKMDEDPAFYKKFSALIKKTIEDYHQERIDEAEYLRQAKIFEEDFLSGKQKNLPLSIQNNTSAKPYYNLSMAMLEEDPSDQARQKDISVEIALGLEKTARDCLFDQGKLRVDWQHNTEVERRMEGAMNRHLIEVFGKYGLETDFDRIDRLIADSVEVARANNKA